MTGNHAAYVLGPYLPAWVTVIIFSIGGLTFPVMAFLIAEGYHHTSNLRRYASRLALFAFISQIPYGLLWGFSGNVLITLLLGLASIHAIERLSSPLSKIGAVGVAIAASSFCDWGIIGPLLICLFHVKRGEGPKGIATSMVVPLVVLGLPAVGYLFAIVGGQELAFSPAASAAQVSALATLGLPTLANATLIGDALFLLPSHTIAAGEIGYVFAGVLAATILLTRYRGRRGRPLKWFFYLYYPLHLGILWLAGVALCG